MNPGGMRKVSQEETYQGLVGIDDAAASGGPAPRGSNAQKIGDLW